MGYEVDYFHARLEWVEGDKGTTCDYESYDRTHQVKCPEKEAITLSAAPQYLGEINLHNPEELFTTAISSCQMLTYLALAAFSGIRILAYTDDAEGVLKKEGSTRWLTQVILRPKILISKQDDAEKAQALVQKAHEQCFIANSVKTKITNQAEVIVA